MLKNISVLRYPLILILAAFGIYTFMNLKFPKSAAGISDVMISVNKSPEKYELSVLFIGNSYTYYNNMPAMLIKMAQSDPNNHTHFIVQSATRGGATLLDHLNNKKIPELISSRKWTYVIIQEQSAWAVLPSYINTLRSARSLNELIKQNGSKTIIFTTWAREPESHWYKEAKFSFMRSPDYMQKQINEKTLDIAQKIGINQIPIGDYWMAALQQKSDFPLYTKDGSHPSAAGSYLSALIFYRYLSGQSVKQITYKPDSVTAQQADFLKNLIMD
ncbi:MAG: hypothetical protein R3D71_07700 [Rickettsiales bacterium]